MTDFPFQNGKTAKLDGDWYFWADRLLSPAEAAEAIRANTCDSVPVPKIWSETGIFEKPDRLLKKGTIALELALPAHDRHWAIKLPNADTACTLYIDGMETAEIGKVGTTADASIPRAGMEIIPFNSNSGKVLLVMQVSNFSNNATGIWSSPLIGYFSAMSRKHNQEILFAALISGALLFSGLYHLMQFLFRRKDSSTLLFGAICILVATYNLFVGERLIIALFPRTANGWELANKIEYLSAHMTLPLFFLFFKKLYPRQVHGVAVKIVLGISALWALFVIFTPAFAHHPFLPFFLDFVILSALYMLVCFIFAIIKKEEGTIILIGGLVVMILTIINDTLLTSSIIHTFYMYSIGMCAFLFSQAILLSRRSSLLFTRVEQYAQELALLNQSLERFIPHEVLNFLGKKSILDVNLGDFSQENMAVFFLDIREFTTLSENMAPNETFIFINAFLNQFGPIVRNNGGFIDKYMGDGIIALFPGDADQALDAALEMRKQLAIFNGQHTELEKPVRFGIGIHKGPLMLGTIGESRRMDSTVISDTVNTASRLEQLTKKYPADILVSREMIQALVNPERFTVSFIAAEIIRGRRRAIEVYALDGDSHTAT